MARVSRSPLFLLFALCFASAAIAASAPNWDHGTGSAVKYAPVAWPSEPANPADCGANCGEWKAYTRFNRSLNDPRVQDPSNGGTAPQNYVNVSSSCSDKAQPSIYYYLKKGAAPADDVIMFRWRVEQIANTYATGTNPGSYGATDPWSSALWTVLFDMTGSGYRTLAAHINGSSGSPSAPVDMLAGIYGKIPTQSIDYLNDPTNIKLLGQNPTAFVDGPNDGNTNRLLNFHDSLAPDALWPNGSSETVWDYGTTRAVQVSTRPCTEYFVDYQIPVAMLDATSLGGPKIDRSTPISMLFCTANSLNNPFQKDCALNKAWQADPNQPGPFGDYVSFDQDKPYVQPIISAVTAQAPASCSQDYTLKATVQDTLAVVNGVVVPSVKAVSFWYYYDANGDGVSNDGSVWTHAADATLVPGALNQWQASWNSKALPKGRYLIGVQAIDDNTLVDDGMTPTGIDNHTFSYVTSNALGEVYLNGSGWQIDQANFPGHSPGLSPITTENWYGNPAITGVQVATAGVDLAINACGVAPTLTKSADSDKVGAGGTITYTLTVANPVSNPAAITLSQLKDVLPAGFTFTGVTGGTLSPTSGPANGDTGTLTWNFASVSITAGASKSLSFTATAPSVTGTYTNTANATTSFGAISSNALQTGVGAPRLSVAIAPDVNAAAPGNTVTYTITYSNDSPVSATGVTLVDTLPAGVTYVSNSCTGGCTYDGTARTLTWSPGDLAAGEGPYSVTFQVSIDTPYAGDATSQDSVVIDGSNTDPSSATASVYVATPRPQLTLRMTPDKALVDPAALAPNNQVTFTITYSNVGEAAASGVVLSNPLPAGFIFDAASGTYTNSGGTVSWNLNTLAIGASGSVTITAHAANPYSSANANPAVDTATLTATNASTVNASASVGVKQSGTLCTNYYFTSTNAGFGGGPVNKLATTATPSGAPGAIPGTIALPKNAETVIAYFLQDPVSASAIDFSSGASTLSGQFTYTKVTTGNLTLKVTTYDYDPTSGTKTQLGTPATYTDNGSGSAPFPLTAGAVTGTLTKGHRLLWVVSAINDTTTKTPQIDLAVDSPGTYVQVCAQPPANLLLEKSVSASSLNLTGSGRTLTYTINYANTSGATSATNAVLTDVLPAGTTYASSSPAATTTPGVGNNGTVTWNLGTIAGNGSGTATVTVNVADDLTGIASLQNTASLVSDQTVSTSDSATTAVIGGGDPAGTPNVIVSLGSDKTLLKPGDTVTYTLTVVNAGDKAATSVNITDLLPANGWFTYVAGSVAGGDSRGISGNTLSWSLTSLAPGATATLTFQMKVANSGVPDGVTALDDSASLTWSSGGIGSATSNTVVVSISTNPNLTFTLSAGAPIAPATAFAPGDLIEYTMTVTNNGSGSASGVVVSNPIPDHTGYSAITLGAGTFDAVNNQVIWNIGTLGAGASVTLKYKVKVASNLDSGTTIITDGAAVSATNASGRDAQVSVTAQAAPRMSLTKAGPASFPLPAATLAVTASSSNSLTLSGTTLLELGDWLRIDGTLTQVTAIAGQVVTVTKAITAASGTAVYRAGVYTINYSNSGNATAQSVAIKDVLPAGLLYVSASPAPTHSPSANTSGTVEWDLSSVAAGESGTLQVIAVPTSSGSITNNATLTFGGDTNPCSGCSPSVTSQVGGLVVTKSTSTATLSAGGIASYTITLANSLNSAVSNVTVTDTLPSGFSYRTATGTPAPTSVSGGQPTWSGITVPANSSYTISFSADVAAGAGSATYQNTVDVAGPGGVGITAWDPLTSTSEDVTLLASGSFVIDGYVFKDDNANGTRDASDPGLQGIAVEINDNPLNVPYVVYTDSNGYFRQTVGAGTWTIAIASSAGNTPLLSGLRLLESYMAKPQASTARTVQFGYVTGSTPAPTSHSLTGTVFDDANSNGLKDAGETGTNAGGLNVVVVDGSGNVIAVSPVSGANGTWSASVLGATGYSAYIATESPAIGAVRSPAANVPAGWSITDGNGGIRSVDATSDRTGLDFAIHLLKADVYAAIALPSYVDSSGTLRALLTFGNQGDLTADAVTYKITGVPTGLSGVTCSGASCSYDPATGEVIVTGLPTSLSAGQASQMVIEFTAPASGDVTLAAAITTTTANDPVNNNSASAKSSVTGTQAEVTTVINAPATVAAGSAVTATVTFANIGSATATGVTYVLTGDTTLTVANGATACTRDVGTGAITGCASGTLSPGQVVTLTVTFTAPGSGSVSLASTVDATNDGDNTNNSAATISRVVNSSDTDLTASVAVPTSAGSKAAMTPAITFRNLGPAAASGITYTLGFTGADAASVTNVSCTGATCTQGAGNSVVVAGLPTSLNPGEAVTITLHYTGPDGGTVGVAASIATTDTESNTGNNSAAATTVFTKGLYTIAVSANPAAGGNVSGGGSFQNGDTATITASANAGYTFVNWTESGTEVSTSTSYQLTVSGSHTFVASFSAVTHTVTFDPNGGAPTPAALTGVADGATISAPDSAPTLSGYTLTGWFTDGGAAWDFANDTVTADITLHAHWAAGGYTVTFDATGGTPVPAALTNVAYGAKITQPASPALNGYTFLAWYKDALLTTPWNFAGDTVTGNITLYAGWLPNTYTVTFDLNGHGTRTGGGTLVQSVSYGGSATAPAIQPASGWFFIGWDKTFNNITSDLTVTAQYSTQYSDTLKQGTTAAVPVTGTATLTGISTLRGGVQTDFGSLNPGDYGSFLSQNPDGSWSFYAYQSGRYTLTFVDPVTGDTTMVVYTIYPNASFATATQTANRGQQVTVRVLLDDKPVEQSATIPYSVTNASLGTAPSPGDLFTRNPKLLGFDITSGAVTCSTTGGCYMDLQFTANADSGAVVFNLKNTASLAGANLGSIVKHTVNLVGPGLAPLSADLELDPGHVVEVGYNGMVATVTGLPILSGRHFGFDWSASDPALGIGGANASSVPFIAPNTVGTWAIRVTVTDLDYPSRAPIQLHTRMRTIANGATGTDCNGDCTTDTTTIPKGEQDPVCGLGVADPVAIPYRLQVGSVTGFDNTGLCLETLPGYGLRLGTVSFEAAPGYGAGVSDGEVGTWGQNGTAPPDASDAGFTHLGIDYDFEVIGLASAGQAAAVVIPLPWGSTIPANAVWREFHPTYGWFTFHTGNGNAVHSAPRIGGNCPSPISPAWHTGLVQGYECVRLTIVDGGSNDLDGAADGVIRDPGTLAVGGGSGSWVVNSRGGSGSSDLFMLMGGLALLWRRRRALMLLGASALLPVTAARAEAGEGWYVGGMVGIAQGHVDGSDVTKRLSDLGLTGGHVSVDNQRNAWRLFAGYQFDDTWAAELGYTNLGEVNTRIVGYAPTDPAPYLAHVNGVAPHTGQGPEAAVLGRYPLQESLFLFGRAGLLWWDADYHATLNTTGGFANEPHSGRSTVIGVGAEYRINESWSTRASWDRYRLAGEDIDLLALGIVYRFGSHTPAPVPAPEPQPAPVAAPAPEAPLPMPAAEPIVVPVPPIVTPPSAPQPPMPAISWIVRYDFNGAGHINYQTVITSLSDYLKTHPGARVELVGHTDSFGSVAYNAKLSLRRAKGLQTELVKRGIDRKRITNVKGVGASQPIADNGTDAGRALNRRTEINVYDAENPK